MSSKKREDVNAKIMSKVEKLKSWRKSSAATHCVYRLCLHAYGTYFSLFRYFFYRGVWSLWKVLLLPALCLDREFSLFHFSFVAALAQDALSLSLSFTLFPCLLSAYLLISLPPHPFSATVFHFAFLVILRFFRESFRNGLKSER